jgi:hypothetical protein
MKTTVLSEKAGAFIYEFILDSALTKPQVWSELGIPRKLYKTELLTKQYYNN